MSSLERAYWLGWSKVPGVGPTLLLRLHRQFGSLAVAWEADAAALEQVEGVGRMTAAAVVAGRSPLNPLELLAEHERTNPHFWTPADADYPQLLLEMPDPPPLLYYRGQVDGRENRGEVAAIALVGTRTPSDYGRKWTSLLSQALALAGFTVVSGLAEGVDAAAHQACLDVGGRTIAVLGTGVNKVYPLSNRQLAQTIDQKGLLVSEYPWGTPPDRANFPRRNRIIAGLCRATLVLEAPTKSGALITARLAMEYNRDVYALPGSLDNEYSRGCLELINNGAQLILSEAHLLDMLSSIPRLDSAANLSLPPSAAIVPPPIDLPPHLAAVFAAIPTEAIALDYLVQQTGLDTGMLLGALLELELMSLVSNLPGMRYQRT